ncbi:MAG: sodium:proton antiporter, partial [Pedobacter sp.]
LPVTIIILVTVVGKLFSSGLGALISGQPLKTSIQTGLSLAQIGEFSFIIATLGMTLNVTSSFLYPITVAVSAITTFTTPYLIKFSFPLSAKVTASLPKKWKDNLDRYSAATQSVSAVSNWQLFLRSYIVNTVIHTIFSIAVIIISSRYIYPFFANQSEGATWGIVATIIITLVMLSPFLYALSFRNLYSGTVKELLSEKLYRNLILVMRVFRHVLAVALLMGLLTHILSITAALVTLVVILIILLIFRQQIRRNYMRIEERFLTNFNKNGAEESVPVLAPWDAHFTEIEVKSESAVIGKTLEELKWRERAGINVAMITRGQIIIHIPSRDTVVYPGDKLYIIGTDTQIRKINSILRPDKSLVQIEDQYQPSLEKVLIRQESILNGKSLRESNIRDLAEGIVVGVERNGQRIVNPESNWVFQENDMVWVVGDHKKIKAELK